MTDLQQTYYRQVKNPNPVFTPRKGAGTLKFCEKLMEKAVGFTSRFDFAIHVAHARSRGLRRRMPPVLRRRAIDALLQGLCFHYDPLANRVQCSITTLAIECGLATESGAGKLSITRATRALTFLSELGLITYQTEYDPLIGCYIPTDITFTLLCLLPLMCLRMQWPLRAAVVLNGKTDSAKSRGWIPWVWMS
ncbi:incFII RepA family protein [Escherichia coli P0304777.15]|nr:incFII RepA family protein [Escherichia coli P0304777.15]